MKFNESYETKHESYKSQKINEHLREKRNRFICCKNRWVVVLLAIQSQLHHEPLSRNVCWWLLQQIGWVALRLCQGLARLLWLLMHHLHRFLGNNKQMNRRNVDLYSILTCNWTNFKMSNRSILNLLIMIQTHKRSLWKNVSHCSSEE